MKKLIAAVAFATVISAPALAQSFDPSVGSGNLVGQVVIDNPLSAFAQQASKPVMTRRGDTEMPGFTANEKALFDRIPIE